MHSGVCLPVKVCLGVCAHRVILNGWLNSCVFIFCVYIYIYIYLSPPVLYSVMNAFPAPCLAPEALVCRII